MAYRKRRSFRPRRKFGRRRFTRKRYPRRTTGAVVPVKLKYVASNLMVSSAGGVLSQGIRVMDPSTCPSFAALTSEWDSYRVTYVTVQYIPHLNDASITLAGPAFGSLYVVYDVDNTVNVASVNDAIQYDTMKIKPLHRAWKYGIKPSFQTSNTATTGLMTTYNKKVGMMCDCANPTSFDRGKISWYATGVLPSCDFGDIIVTYWTKFANRY